MTHQNLRLGKYWKLFWATLKPIVVFVCEIYVVKCLHGNVPFPTAKQLPIGSVIFEEIIEDVRKCFNVKEIESQEDLCGSCRGNLTRWREGPTNTSKYFVLVNSRGQPCINRSTVARKNRKTVILRSATPSHELSLLVSLPEDLFLFITEFLSVADVSRLWHTCRYAKSLVKTRLLQAAESSRRNSSFKLFSFL